MLAVNPAKTFNDAGGLLCGPRSVPVQMHSFLHHRSLDLGSPHCISYRRLCRYRRQPQACLSPNSGPRCRQYCAQCCSRPRQPQTVYFPGPHAARSATDAESARVHVDEGTTAAAHDAASMCTLKAPAGRSCLQHGSLFLVIIIPCEVVEEAPPPTCKLACH